MRLAENRWLGRHFAFCLYLAAGAMLCAQEKDRRIRIALQVFPRVLALESKLDERLQDEKKLQIVFLYLEDRIGTQIFADELAAKVTKIRDFKVRIRLIRMDRFDTEAAGKTAAVFVAERLRDFQLSRLISLGEQQKVFLFSPFESDVEAGIHCGIFIQARVLPYLNQETVSAAGIRFHPDFLRIAKVYVP